MTDSYRLTSYEWMVRYAHADAAGYSDVSIKSQLSFQHPWARVQMRRKA